ncbi:MAG: hypothetical protein M1829_001797 [Trizodia sp. TS-e1964]|nr:MAG: hypothetical protein M1829_001797 [Trizodia sp. TS-e1964]
MSSPFANPGNIFPGSAPMSPISASGAPAAAFGEPDSSGIVMRRMRLKVLYTFDDQNKTNCLARWPYELDVKTVLADEGTWIGVIELKTCIQAIVAASPELVAKLGQDYTVYAYDYSEYETPLVGQGMLSWALAAASPTPGAPAHQSRSMITGRVCTNILGLFSNGAKETLEVKLRLVPVPNCLQSEYISSMQKYRELSKIMPSGFDPSEWTSYLQANPELAQLADNLGGMPSTTGSWQRNDMGMEFVNQLLSQGPSPDEMADNESVITGHGAALSRSNSFNSPVESAFPRNSRPCSRMSMRMPSQDSHSRSASFSAPISGPAPADFDYNASVENSANDEPAKKRAKITKTDWKGKSTFATNRSSLRVAASTAASVRVYQPLALKPAAGTFANLDDMPRPPTPHPTDFSLPRQKPPQVSNLRRQSLSSDVPSSPQSFHDVPEDISKSFESPARSPEEHQLTPPNITSSPPVMERAPTTVPSSPAFPDLPGADSGFMSGNYDDLFGEDDEMRPIDELDMQNNSQYVRRPGAPQKGLIFHEVNPGPPELLPTRIPPRPSRERVRKSVVADSESALSSDAGCSPEESASLPALARKRSTGSRKTRLPPKKKLPTLSARPPAALPVSQVPASDPVMGAGQVQSPFPSQQPASDAPTPSETIAVPAKKGSKRKQCIQSNLAKAIESGEVPRFCRNCGEIETATWRRVWTKVIPGSPIGVLMSDDDGGIAAIDDVVKNAEGLILSYKITKRTLLETDEDFTVVILCNPCGLWFNKTKSMRPRAQWEKLPKDPNEKKVRSRKSRKKVSRNFVYSEADLLRSDAALATDGCDDAPQEDEPEAPPLPQLNRTRAADAHIGELLKSGKDNMNDAAVAAALQLAIQSSPARFLGTRHKPIEVDDLGSTKRTLFSSPRKEGMLKTLEDGVGGSPPLPATQESILEPVDPSDKENCPPSADGDDLASLFDEAETPKTPIVAPMRNPFKTPPARNSIGNSRSPFAASMLGSIGKAMASPHTPRSGSLGKAHLSPEQATPFTAQINRLLSDANCSPTLPMCTYQDLPTFGNFLSPSRFNLNELDPEELISTEMQIPSSPPYFALYEDPAEASSALWTDFNMPRSPQDADLDGFDFRLETDEARGEQVFVATNTAGGEKSTAVGQVPKDVLMPMDTTADVRQRS